MTTKVIASTSGTESATTMPVRQPRERKLTRSTMPSASSEGALELEDRVVDDLRLVGDLLDVDALRHACMKASVAFFTSSPNSRMLAPFAITTPMPSAGLPRWRTR